VRRIARRGHRRSVILGKRLPERPSILRRNPEGNERNLAAPYGEDRQRSLGGCGQGVAIADAGNLRALAFDRRSHQGVGDEQRLGRNFFCPRSAGVAGGERDMLELLLHFKSTPFPPAIRPGRNAIRSAGIDGIENLFHSDALYSWHLVPEGQRSLPPAAESAQTRALLHVILVDADMGIVLAVRMVSFSPDFTRSCFKTWYKPLILL